MSTIQQLSVENCLKQVTSSTLSVQQIQRIINNYQPVTQPQLPSLSIINSNLLTKTTYSKLIHTNNNNIQLEEQFYQEKFIPSPDLLLNYQNIFIKALSQNNSNQSKTPIINNKLHNLYQKQSMNNNNINPYAHQTNNVNTPTTIPYRNLTPNYNQFPPTAQNPRVFIQQRQQTILQQLQKQSHGLQMSIPIIQNSLIQNQIKRLQQKNIKLQNMTGVKAWKIKRQQLLNKLTDK